MYREYAMHFRLMGLMIALTLAPGCSKKPLEKRSNAELERMLNDPDPKVQAQGAYGLAQHGADSRAAMPALIRALSSTDPLVRQQASIALGKIGPAALDAVPALILTLDDAEWAVRRQSAVSLGQIGPPIARVEEPLRRREQDENTLVRKAAKEALTVLRGNGT